MAYDKVYYFDKITNIRHELGEIQTNFNLNLVIDGEKDSAQVDVYSFVREPMQPNTIIQHPNDPLQWYVVKKDQVKRYANEQGFFYTHSLTLNGAIDLLVNRDLIDCGFNANNYTIDTFFKKLLKLSNFEFEYEIEYNKNIDEDKKIDYIKSYENYTLLSAIRDFFNGYNCEVKMVFQTKTQNNNVIIDKAIFKIIPRTGNIDLTPIDISALDDIRENINFDKESFGTTVVSNAQNVVSTLAKTYPQVGGVRAVGDDYASSWQGLHIKLPSPAYKVNYVRMFSHTYVVLEYGNTHVSTRKMYLTGYETAEQALIELEQEINNSNMASDSKEYILGIMHDSEQRKIIRDTILASSRVTLYNNPSYNPHTDQLIQEATTPYFPYLTNDETGSDHAEGYRCLMDKDSRQLLKNPYFSIYWERGSDEIRGLETFNNVDDGMGVYYIINPDSNDTKAEGLVYPLTYINPNSGVRFRFLTLDLDVIYSHYRVYFAFSRISTAFQVNYIPMADIKVKQDNENNTKDIKLYNQNGKLNDSVALSKMIDSYSKEIKNPTITRYMYYTNFSDVPQVGTIVNDGTTKYVVNNISYDVYPNETNNANNVGYYIECEFTLAEYISTKSIMTSPNTNVRDYGIPQKYNIKRRQVYRDYYEFGFVEEQLANNETPYAKLENYLQLGASSTPKDFDHTALIKIDYEEEVSGQTSWYYQLNSTAYTMAKSVYEIIDFNDNNIIGYDIQNTKTGFNMSDLWNDQIAFITTPVSYVDDNGKFVGITLQMVRAETLEDAYLNVGIDYHGVLLSAHCFINDTLYNLVASAERPFISNEYNGSQEYNLTPSDVGYGFVFSLTKNDVGIPSDVIATQITEIIDLELTKNDDVVDSSSYYYSFVPIGNNIGVFVTFYNAYSTLGEGGTLHLFCKFRYNRNVSIADYVIDEPNYEKDAIEVPVFEYSLQLGDTKDVEVGDNILKNNVGMLSFYTCAIVNKNTATPLNASKWFTGLSVSGDTYSDPNENYDCQVEISDSNYVDFALEENNTILRIKVYKSNITSLFYGVEDTQSFSLQSVSEGNVRYTKAELKDKDIVIFRHTIKSIKYDETIVHDNATCEYDTELMYIIHAPQEAQFDDDDLVINVNYYKLK